MSDLKAYGRPRVKWFRHTWRKTPKSFGFLHTSWCMWVWGQYPRVHATFDLKPAYIEISAYIKILLEFSFIWVWTTWLLAFHMPWDRSKLTLHYLFGVLYKEPLGYIEEEEWKRKETIVHCCHSLLILESTSLCPFRALCVLPKLSFVLWYFYREMEDWGGGGLDGGLSFSGS